MALNHGRMVYPHQVSPKCKDDLDLRCLTCGEEMDFIANDKPFIHANGFKACAPRFIFAKVNRLISNMTFFDVCACCNAKVTIVLAGQKRKSHISVLDDTHYRIDIDFHDEAGNVVSTIAILHNVHDDRECKPGVVWVQVDGIEFLSALTKRKHNIPVTRSSFQDVGNVCHACFEQKQAFWRQEMIKRHMRSAHNTRRALSCMKRIDPPSGPSNKQLVSGLL